MEDSIVEEIKRRLDIVDVVGGYIKLKKVGVNYTAFSPFHTEKNPSFFVSPSKQIWHDFSLGKGGDIFRFVMEIENIDFREALKTLAKKAGVELKESPEFKKTNDQKQRMHELNELACQFFEKQLDLSVNGQKARDYLHKRKVTDDSIRKWRIGWAPDTWHSLVNFLVSKKFSTNEIEQAGLALRSSRGDMHDRFRGRIMYPIADITGQIAGFTGRVLTKAQEAAGMAKYMNIPNTLLYDKSRILYGLDKAKVTILKNDSCILVEGQMDEIMSHQAGIENAVAVSGTALTPSHLLMLKRYTKNLIIAFDMDLGGNNATERGIKMALANDFNVRVMTMPPGQDPGDIIQENPETWQKMVGNTKSIVEFYFEVAMSRWDSNDVDGKKRIGEMVLPVIRNIQNKIEQMHWISKFSAQIGIKEDAIIQEMQRMPQEREQDYSIAPEKIIEPAVKNRKEKLQERVVALFAKYKSGITMPDQWHLQFLSQDNQDFVTKIANDQSYWENCSSNFRDYVNDLVFQLEIDHDKLDNKIKPQEELLVCLKELSSISVKEEMAKISEQIKTAQYQKDEAKVKELCEEFDKLSKKIASC